MTVQHNAVITCNQCGKEQVVRTESSLNRYWGAPDGWMTVNYIYTSSYRFMGTDTPDELRQKRPDLCSWNCVSQYAAEKAAGG